MTQFNSYVKIADDRFRENYGLTFEDFQIGQKFAHRPGITVSQEDNKHEAIDSINNAQLHYDENYASQTEWKKCLFDSTLTLQVIMGMPWKTFARKKSIVKFNTIDMLHPVFGGDTLYTESEILDKQEISQDPDVGMLTIASLGINQSGETICKIEYQLLIYKKGKHPAEKQLPESAFQLAEERFSAYRMLDNGRLIEQVGLFYEELQLDEIYEHFPSKTISLEECRMHAYRALDWHPMYSNTYYNELYQDGKFYVNESLLIGVMTALTTRTFGRVVANLEWKNIQFGEKLLAGDTLNAESKITSMRESKSRPTQGIIGVMTYAYNQHQALVCSYERHLSSFALVGVLLGILLGTGIVAFTTFIFSKEQLMNGGWRIPFLLSAILGYIVLSLRRHLAETRAFEKIKNQSNSEPPLERCLRLYKKPVLQGFAITILNAFAFYILLIYTTTYFNQILKFAMLKSTAINFYLVFITLILVPFTGWLSDIWGRKKVMGASALGFILLAYPMNLFFLDVSNLYLFLAGQALIAFLLAMYLGPMSAILAEIIPTEVRYTGLSLSYNTALALFGGTAPLIVTFLIEKTGISTIPGILLTISALISFIAILSIKETSAKPLI